MHTVISPRGHTLLASASTSTTAQCAALPHVLSIIRVQIQALLELTHGLDDIKPEDKDAVLTEITKVTTAAVNHSTEAVITD